MVYSHQNTGSNSYEKVETFKYLGSLLTKQNSIQEEIKCRLKAGNSCYIQSKHSCLLDFFLRINLPFLPPSSINQLLFLSCRPFVVITILSTGLVGVEVTSVSWLGQLTVGVQITDYCNCWIIQNFKN